MKPAHDPSGFISVPFPLLATRWQKCLSGMSLMACAGCFPYRNVAGKHIPEAIVHMREGGRKRGEDEQMSDTSPRG